MLVVLSKDDTRSPSGKLQDTFQSFFLKCASEEGFAQGRPWSNDELKIARERVAVDNVPVEAVPNENAQQLIRDFNISLPIHTGRTKKSLQANQLGDIDAY